jgi:hypothetical protein
MTITGPTIVDITPKNTWQKIATNVRSGQVWVLNGIVEYLVTYRPTTGAAPTGQAEGVDLEDVHVIQASDGIDVYVMALNGVGKVRVDL